MHAARIKARAKFPLGVLTAIPSSPCVNIIGAGEWLLRRSIFAGSPTSCALPTFLFGTTSLSELLNPVGLLSPLNPVRLGNTNEVCRATGCMRNTSEVCSTPCESCSDDSKKFLQARREQRPFGLPTLVRSALPPLIHNVPARVKNRNGKPPKNCRRARLQGQHAIRSRAGLKAS